MELSQTLLYLLYACKCGSLLAEHITADWDSSQTDIIGPLFPPTGPLLNDFLVNIYV